MGGSANVDMWAIVVGAHMGVSNAGMSVYQSNVDGKSSRDGAIRGAACGNGRQRVCSSQGVLGTLESGDG